MTTGARHAAATTAARNYLERIAPDLDVQVAELDGADGYWQGEADAPHPLAPDVAIHVRVSGTSRDGARELVRLELQNLAYRCAIDPAAHARAANRTREAYLWSTQRAHSTERVRQAVLFRHGRSPTDAEIDQAALAVRVREGRSAIYVGEVATEVLNRQAFPITEGPQGALVL